MSQITTHILDTANGKPAEGVTVKLQQSNLDNWTDIASGTTNADGRVVDWLVQSPLPAGSYKVVFATKDYFDRINTTVFYPVVEVIFNIEGDGQHYHIPLLLNPFGYSTYRGS